MSARTGSLIRTAFWLAMVPIAYVTGWLSSVIFVSLVSIWALVETAFAAWRADCESPAHQEQMDRIEKLLERREP